MTWFRFKAKHLSIGKLHLQDHRSRVNEVKLQVARPAGTELSSGWPSELDRPLSMPLLVSGQRRIRRILQAQSATRPDRAVPKL
jgi:hypothetical protein